MAAMAPAKRPGFMSRISHESVSSIFTFVYAFLSVNIMLALANAPLVFFTAVVADPLASWPFFVALSVTVPPSLAGAFAVFQAMNDDAALDAKPFRNFVLGYVRAFRTTGPIALAAVALVGILVVDIVVVASMEIGPLLVPLLAVLTAMAVVVAVQAVAGAVILPGQGLRVLVRAALFLAVKRWYLSLATLALLAMVAGLTLVQPILGATLAPAPLLFVVWSNMSYTTYAALRAVSAPASTV